MAPSKSPTPTLTYRQRRELEGRPIVDNRRGRKDYHKPRPDRNTTHNAKSKWERREIVAWDGEGYDIEPNRHVYNLLCNSNVAYLSNSDGLSTESVFDFFFTHSSSRAINVIFGGSYDVNMLLRDLPRDKIDQLWRTGSCWWGRYKILYAPRKKFTIHRYNPDGKHDDFILWDVLGYFQATFVNACRKWLGDLPILNFIENMKLRRGEFEDKDFEEILKYCFTECQLLVSLVKALFDAMDEGDITLSRYDGAGSIASALLRKHGVRDHMGEPTMEVKRWAQYAYSGGWIEPMKLGNLENSPIHRDDINSAYPSAMMTLPSYLCASWSLDKEWNGCTSSLVRVRWNFKKGAPFYPLFFREPDGSIIHPKTGEGIYYGVEIKNLEKYHSGEYEILEACNVHLANDTKPFAFNEEVYQLRLMFKALGSMASEALKLGMNSEYGKTAQQLGWSDRGAPTYHQLLWAGETTAATRAKLYDAAMQNPRAVIAFATDAIISTEAFDLPHSNALGDWTHELFNGITIVQAGVYFLQGEITDDNPTGWHEKYRGFDKGALLRNGIVAAWEAGEDNYRAHLTRFVTMGSALARKPEDFLSYWRTWRTEPRDLDIWPGGKRAPGHDTRYQLGLCDTLPTPNYNGDLLSAPFPLEWVMGNEAELTLLKQMREIQREYEDSFA